MCFISTNKQPTFLQYNMHDNKQLVNSDNWYKKGCLFSRLDCVYRVQLMLCLKKQKHFSHNSPLFHTPSSIVPFSVSKHYGV